ERGIRASRRRGHRTGAGTAALLLPGSRLLRRRGCRRGLGRRGLLGLPVGGLLAVLLREPDLEVEEEADRLLLDRLVHRLEQLEALALVLHERVALGHRPQADALLEVVHL